MVHPYRKLPKRVGGVGVPIDHLHGDEQATYYVADLTSNSGVEKEIKHMYICGDAAYRERLSSYSTEVHRFI